jgi:hypothetical protein
MEIRFPAPLAVEAADQLTRSTRWGYDSSPDSLKAAMRNHPLMSYRGQPNWPPVWIWTGKGENKFPSGEVGVLNEVHISINDPNVAGNAAPFHRLYLFIDYRDSSYVGMLPFDDPAACRQVGRVLATQCGKSLQEIGKIDLARFLATRMTLVH